MKLLAWSLWNLKVTAKPNAQLKKLRVLILDLYVKWLKDPAISIGYSKTKNSYKVESRYNGLYIPEKIFLVEELLVSSGYIEELPYYHSKKGQWLLSEHRLFSNNSFGVPKG